MEPWVVARNDLLMKVAAERTRVPDQVKALMAPFRFEEYGAAILAVLNESSENARDG